MRPSEMLALNRKLASPAHLRPISRDRVPFQKGFPAWIPQTNTLLWGINWTVMVETVKKHARENGLVIEDLKTFVDEAVCAGLPKAGRGIAGFCVKKQQPSAAEKVTIEYYKDSRAQKLSGAPRGRSPKDWAAMHLAALAGNMTPEYIRGMTTRIGCGSCKTHWLSALRKSPPDFTNAESQFVSSVKLHNLINARLGKPQLTVEQAKEIWK